MLILERFCDCPEMGVFGRLLHNGKHIAYTVEDPWRDNMPFKSCIPDGRYKLEQHASDRYGDTVAMVNHLNDVFHYAHERIVGDQRYGCLIHWGNTERAVEGCIAVGEGLGFVNGKWAVTNSKATWAKVKSILTSGEELTIIWKDHP